MPELNSPVFIRHYRVDETLVGQSAINPDKGRELVTRTLALVQGHPKLMELAEAQANDPYALEKALDKAAQVCGKDNKLSSFFEDGRSHQDEEDFLKSIKGWTQSVSESLPTTSRTLFHVLCALEECDRLSDIVWVIWPELWEKLQLPGPAPEIKDILESLKVLIDVRLLKTKSRYDIHPVVAEAGLAETDKGFRIIVDSVMADFCSAMFCKAIDDEMSGTGWLAAEFGQRAVPYHMRLGQWEEAADLIDMTISRDQSREAQAMAIPVLRRIVEATRETEYRLKNDQILAKSLFLAGRWQDAEARLRSLIPEFVKLGNFRFASIASCYLIQILRNTGMLTEALELVETKKGYTLQAFLGPWTQLQEEVLRLQILEKMGRYDEVLENVEELKNQMESLPENREQNEIVEPWNLKEGILNVGGNAASDSKNYSLSLDFNAAALAIMHDRGATELELTRTRFNNCVPLQRLERYKEAENLLLSCKDVFERENDIAYLGMAFSALASLEDELGQTDQATRLNGIALRYDYLTGDSESISISHHNQANYLYKNGSKEALAHRLAAGLIYYQMGSGLLNSTLQGLIRDLAGLGSDAAPANFDQLCQIVEMTDGVKFRELFHRLAGPGSDGDKVMQEVLRMAQ